MFKEGRPAPNANPHSTSEPPTALAPTTTQTACRFRKITKESSVRILNSAVQALELQSSEIWTDVIRAK